MNPTKSRAFKCFEYLPIFRDTGDPEYAGIFFLFACAVVGALLAFGQGGAAYTDVLQTAGGALVVLGVYLTTVTVRTNRSDQYAGRLMSAIGQLDSQSEAVRLGTLGLLEAILIEVPDVTTKDLERVARYKRAVIAALDAIAKQGETREATLARAVSRKVAGSIADTAEL